jgi:phosphoribosylglycinamide formyltransferase 1
MLDVAVLASGRGTNLQALIDYASDIERGVSIRCVVSDREHAGALERARAAAIPAHFVDPRAFDGRAAFDAAVDARLVDHGVTLVLLAGFMRVLGSALVQKWHGSMLNIHPSLLPAYRGLHTHQRVLDAGDPETGASVHFVTETLDGGPVILQAVVPIARGDDAASLAARVQAQEHRIYPFAVGLFAQGRIALTAEGVNLDGAPLATPLRVTEDADLACVA